MTGSEQSVHLLDYPTAGEVNTKVIDEMARTREIITEGLAQRMNKSDTEEQIKVRQPLSELTYDGEKLDEFYEKIIAEEVNVKKVVHGTTIKLNKELNDELRAEGFVRELIRVVQSARKKAGLSVDDRIKLFVGTPVPEKWLEMLAGEVLATELHTDTDVRNYEYDEIVKVNGEQITISLEK